MDILKPARDEIILLEKSLSEMQSRLADLRAFVDAGDRLYGMQKKANAEFKLQGAPSAAAQLDAPRLEPVRPPETQNASEAGRGNQSKASRIVAVVKSVLADGGHKRAKELVEILQSHGIELGSDPIGSLSAYMSKSGVFVSERAKGGWTLKSSAHKEKPPLDVGASTGA